MYTRLLDYEYLEFATTNFIRNYFIANVYTANSIGSFGDQHEYLSLSPLADSPLSVSGSSPPVSDSVDRDSDPSDLHCQQCREPVSDSKLLACFHTFCNACLEKNKFVCPRCNSEYPEQFAVQL
ncbi:unnamed protein product [Callosobruchus maculatus]|uniref:RING-type domain-containing protein n=1 Tax=Callosobruchus maculatus TaxID=64391 RepID=A0A653DC48_CALMS|nr:unnamed protein product [Callosobruchus maculatus]